MDEAQIIASIGELKASQQERREAASRGEITRARELADIADLEVSMDRAWDLLRQRRALREFGQDEDEARLRPADEVENYRQ